jgi:hypothetical protein
MRLTVNSATSAIVKEAGVQPRHDMLKLVNACRTVAKKHSFSPWEAFRLLCFNEPIAGYYTHSYGFHTATGRAIIDQITEHYHKYEMAKL